MDKFNENMKSFMTERQEESIRKLRRDNADYDKLRRTHADESQYMEEIINSLPLREQNFTQGYREDESRIISMDCQHLFRQLY